MDRTSLCAALSPALLLLACEARQSSANEASPEPAAPPASVTGTGTAAPAPGAPPAAPAPPALTPEAERGETGARDVLLDFARAIELKRYDQAWAMLSPADQRKWSRTAFAAMFADLGKITVAVPTGTMEGAAGSSYYSAPVTITASARDGRPVRIEGEAVLRRVNDVDGASAAQLRWHFETLTLDWTH
jgi:3-oxoacyl-ACP reductase-like protein